MDYIALGKSNLLVSRTAFGAMGLGDIEDHEAAIRMVRNAYEQGINFFDTSCESPESERRLGEALEGLNRKDVFIATKTAAHSAQELVENLGMSLSNLKTDYIDLYQIEKFSLSQDEEAKNELIEKLLNLRESGTIKHIGFVTDTLEIARAAVEGSGPWETIQFPFNMACDNDIVEFTRQCAGSDIGFIAMRPLFSGILTNIPLALGYLKQFENVVPLWGVTNEEELQQILYFTQNPPRIDEQFLAEVENVRSFFN